MNRTNKGQGLPWGRVALLGGFVEAFQPSKEDIAVKVCGEDGIIEDQEVTASLATQFSVNRKAGQSDLPVDREEYLPALWRVNTPLVQSREPRAGSLTVEKSKEVQGAVNLHCRRRQAG